MKTIMHPSSAPNIVHSSYRRTRAYIGWKLMGAAGALLERGNNLAGHPSYSSTGEAWSAGVQYGHKIAQAGAVRPSRRRIDEALQGLGYEATDERLALFGLAPAGGAR